MVTRDHPYYPVLQVLNTVLGGYFGSRLMANIREDKGYTYGIGSGLHSLKGDGIFFIATEVGVDVSEKALQEIYHELIRLQDEPIPRKNYNWCGIICWEVFWEALKMSYPMQIN